MNTQMIDLTNVVIAIMVLIGALISTFLVPYIKTRLTNEQLGTVKFWVNVAVKAAEMIYTGSGLGTKKKEYVVAFLNEKGFKLNTDELDNLIEAAVLELKKATEPEQPKAVNSN